jgi:uncharacterized protein
MPTYPFLPTVFPGSLRTALCALAVFSAAPALSAQDSGTFVHRVGRDTVSIERFAWHEGRLEGDLQFRVSPWHAYQLELTEEGQVTSFAVTVRSPFAPVDYQPLQAIHLEFYADSVLEKSTRSDLTEERRRWAGPGAVPMLYPSLALLEVATRRARRSGAHEADVSFIETGTFGQRQFTVAISWVGRDSAVLNVGGTEFRLAADADGRVLGGRVPSRNMVIDRVQARIELRAPVYAAPPDALYTAEEVRIATPGGHFAVGTLTRPINVQGPVAVAVTISGSGPQDRDGIIPSIEGYRPFREIAEALAGRGIALLRYDDRGVGGSTAGEGRTTQDLAEDVRAIVAYLRSREDIDESRIALIGHSEGGLIAPMLAASDSAVAAIVLMAAPAWTGRRVLQSQLRVPLDANPSLSESAKDSVVALRLAQIESTAAPWMRFFLEYDPLATARRITVPVLILQGATDTQVTQEQATELEAAFRAGGNTDVTVHVLPRVNHMFLDDADGRASGYHLLPSGEVNREVLHVLSEWLSRRLSNQSRPSG